MSDEINSENATEGNEKKSSKKWLAGLVIAALILLWVAPPLAAELYLRDNIGNLMRADSPDEVNLDTNTFKLLSGSFDNLEVKGSNLKIGNLKIDKYELI